MQGKKVMQKMVKGGTNYERGRKDGKEGKGRNAKNEKKKKKTKRHWYRREMRPEMVKEKYHKRRKRRRGEDIIRKKWRKGKE